MAGAGERARKTLEQKPWLITLGLAGILVVLVGIVAAGFNLKTGNEPQIEIIETSATPATTAKIMVDIGGAVIKPGIYELAADARINDALVTSGGLAADADRDWVSINLNLAEKLADGGKIYVPFREETGKVGPSQSKGPTFSEKINLNTASLNDLDTLWGVGPVTAQKIIDNRPYAKIEDLLEKKVVKTNVFEAIKNQISVL